MGFDRAAYLCASGTEHLGQIDAFGKTDAFRGDTRNWGSYMHMWMALIETVIAAYTLVISKLLICLFL